MRRALRHFVCHDIQFSFEKKIRKNTVICKHNSFKCAKSELCINLIYVCNNITDCPLNDDEENCTRFELSEFFSCESNDQRILFSKLCDYQNDCIDRSDEKYCSMLFLLRDSIN